jgi:hypothetical protein
MIFVKNCDTFGPHDMYMPPDVSLALHLKNVDFAILQGTSTGAQRQCMGLRNGSLSSLRASIVTSIISRAKMRMQRKSK